MLTRREFTKGSALILIGGTLPMTFMSGCNLATDILTWEPIALAAFNGGVSALETFGILTGNPEITLIIGAVRTGFSDLVQDAQLYEAINPPPVGALAEISAVLNLIAGNLKDFFSMIVSTYAPIINLIIGLGQLLLGTIAGFLRKAGVALVAINKTLAETYKFHAAGTIVDFVPLDISAQEFKKRWNKICASQGHPEIGIQ